MCSKIETLFCVVLSWSIHIHCYNKVLNFTSNCFSWDYEKHDVSSSQTYDLVFRGITPPRKCKIGFYQRYGKVCAEATSYDVSDCDIKLRFSTNSFKSYSCHDPPTTKECAYFGTVLNITLSTELQFGSHRKNSSFTLHISQGEVLTLSIESIIGFCSAIAFIALIGYCISHVKRRCVQRDPYMIPGSRTPPLPTVTPTVTPAVVYHAVQQQPATGITIHHPVQQQLVQGYGPPSGYGNRPTQPHGYEPMIFRGYGPSTSAHEYRSLTTDVHRQQIPQTYSPSLAHGHGDPPGQDHVVEKGHHSYTDQNAPPPSYEEAVKYDA